MKFWFRTWINFLLSDIRQFILKLLKLDIELCSLNNQIQDVEKQHHILSQNLIQLRKDFNDQISMVGIDSQPFSNALENRHAQTQIIFISRLGRSNGGTVRIIDVHFKSVSEMLDYIRHLERMVPPEKITFDGPPGMAEDFGLAKSRRLW